MKVFFYDTVEFREVFRLPSAGSDVTSLSFMTSSAILAVATFAGDIRLVAKGDDAEWYVSNCVRFQYVEIRNVSLVRFVHTKGDCEYDTVSTWVPTC